MQSKRPHRAFKVRCAGCVVYRHGPDGVEIAIARRADGQWSFPRGKVAANERPRAAAVREAREEIGISVRATVEVGAYVYPIGRARYKHVEFFAAVPVTEQELTPDGREFIEARWCDPVTARNLLSGRDAVLVEALEQLATADALT